VAVRSPTGIAPKNAAQLDVGARQLRINLGEKVRKQRDRPPSRCKFALSCESPSRSVDGVSGLPHCPQNSCKICVDIPLTQTSAEFAKDGGCTRKVSRRLQSGSTATEYPSEIARSESWCRQRGVA
jgi:hypothetical protein